MSKLDILKDTVPDLVMAMKATLKADQSKQVVLLRDFQLLLMRMSSVYPVEIVEAAYLIALIRVERWLTDYQKTLQIKEALQMELKG